MVLKSSTHGKETAENIPSFVLKWYSILLFTILPSFKIKEIERKCERTIIS